MLGIICLHELYLLVPYGFSNILIPHHILFISCCLLVIHWFHPRLYNSKGICSWSLPILVCFWLACNIEPEKVTLYWYYTAWILFLWKPPCSSGFGHHIVYATHWRSKIISFFLLLTSMHGPGCSNVFFQNIRILHSLCWSKSNLFIGQFAWGQLF